jgi:AbiJ N-terminal domain 4
MAIKLWQRKQGVLRPPDRPTHAVPDSREFPDSFRQRIMRWVVSSIAECQAFLTIGSHSDPTRVMINLLCMELADAYGRSALVDPRDMRGVANTQAALDAERQLPAHLERCTDFEVLDLIDATMQKLRERLTYEAGWQGQQLREQIAVQLNTICEEEGIGYRLVDEELIRFDDGVAHELAIEPALQLLAARNFRNADGEFRRSLECYRAGHWRDAITNANAAFESVLKIATGQSKGTAGQLIATARSQGLIPGYMVGAAESLQRL